MSMKISRLYMVMPLFLALLFMVACADQGTEGNATDTTESATPAEGEATEGDDMSGPEYTSAYVCPMHCEGSGSAEPGTCPVCGMEYVASADLQDGGGGMHDHDHDGHDHQH